MGVRLQFHGAAGCVTGACFRLTTPRAEVLIDCGMFQGSKSLKALNYGDFPFDPTGVDAVLLTHAHIDHSGLIPKLIKAGFGGPVLATAATRDLCQALLPDAGGIQEQDVEHLNRRLRRQGRPEVEPIYGREDGEAALKRFRAVAFHEAVDVAPGVVARFWPAGHLLGAASIEVEVAREGGAPLRLLFSGDVGPADADFVRPPEGPSGVDHLILESTYGARERPTLPPEARLARLERAVVEAHRAGGPLLIPTFAVQRAQEVLLDLLALMDARRIPETPLFLDSPLADRATGAFLRHGGDATGTNPYARLRDDPRLVVTETPDDSRALERVRGWHAILAGSGMCDAGRIRHHLKRWLWRDQATVLLVGYQAAGTLGRRLQEGARSVTIQGEPVRVRARLETLDVYSGHADGPGLAAWATARAPVAGGVFLTHGEPDEIEGLRARLVAAGFDAGRIAAPEIDQSVDLDGGRPRLRKGERPARLAPGRATARDWAEDRSRFLVDLEEALDQARDAGARERLLAELREALERTADEPRRRGRRKGSARALPEES